MKKILTMALSLSLAAASLAAAESGVPVIG